MTAPNDAAFAAMIVSNAQHAPIAGRFSELQLLGTGFTSLVFSTTDSRSNRPAVLKFLKPWADPYRTECFKREALAAEKLIGRGNVIQLVGSLDVLPISLVDPNTGATFPISCQYFALERARASLTDFLFGHRRPRSLFRRLEVMQEVVKGVNRLHNAGYCHRDLKPDNILLFARGVVKIADLGTCRLHSGVDPIVADYLMPAGDMNYSAPETFNGAGNDPSLYLASDWFSVGAILFEAVTGQNLYLSIGLRGPLDIRSALAVASNPRDYIARVGSIAGRYPVPSTLDFATESWLAPMSDATLGRVGDLIRDMCHFDYHRRLTHFATILNRLQIAALRARRELEIANATRNRGSNP